MCSLDWYQVALVQYILVHGPIHCSFNYMKLSCTLWWKTDPDHLLNATPPCFIVGMVISGLNSLFFFLQTWQGSQGQITLSWSHQTKEYYFSRCLAYRNAPWQHSDASPSLISYMFFKLTSYVVSVCVTDNLRSNYCSRCSRSFTNSL